MADDERVADRKTDARGVDPDAAAAALEPWIVELLACPVDRGAVRLDQTELVCIQCGHRYPVLFGIPRMIPGQDEDEQKF